MPLQRFYFKSICRTAKCVRGLTSRGDHWGEDQQARYPHLERHPEPISPDNVVSSNWFQRWNEMTELHLYLPSLLPRCGTGSGEELLCQVTLSDTLTSTFLPHMNTLCSTHGKTNSASSFASYSCFWCLDGYVTESKSFKINLKHSLFILFTSPFFF